MTQPAQMTRAASSAQGQAAWLKQVGLMLGTPKAERSATECERQDSIA